MATVEPPRVAQFGIAFKYAARGSLHTTGICVLTMARQDLQAAAATPPSLELRPGMLGLPGITSRLLSAIPLRV